MVEKFDAIVVGAGPAGCTAAYTLAKDGLSVLVLERGESAGSKNVSGAILYGEVLNSLIADFWQEAPVERWIVSQTIVFLGADSSLEVKFTQEQTEKPVGLSVLRSKFDSWFAGKAVEAGASILTATLVDDVILKDGKVIGVKVAKEKGEAYADVVILADGVNSLLAEKARLRRDFRPGEISLGVKEVLSLPINEIEQRFHLSGNEGAAYSFVGDGTQGLPGGCFLYTNKDSLSLGAVVSLDSLKKAHLQPDALLDHFKEHRAVSPLISGGTLKEYSAHLIPEGGYDMIPSLYSDGVLVVGDAAGFTMNSGLILRGMDLAIASGIAAAQTVKMAKESNDFSARSLSRYQHLLEQGFVLRDLKKFRRLNRLLQSERIYKDYPSWLSRAAKSFFNVDTSPRKGAFKLLLKEKPDSLNYLRVISDILRGMRDL